MKIKELASSSSNLPSPRSKGMRSIAVGSVQFENGGCRLGEEPQLDLCGGKNGCAANTPGAFDYFRRHTLSLLLLESHSVLEFGRIDVVYV
jgi:hypothetical protein